ncbi:MULTISPECIES: hypothetical protein [unclassified Variovorax]|uniref:hypothetical protein n=1 Tax=unclassified Variovorax TaxID=663243 RepID=UPI00076D83B9|nr:MULTISPECIES: hypothetical protein [unclassified Variovorax]KWT98133.1 hypothetical protein APY03_0804 [Variovorax sp. WDL1]PNG50390.1 hypothetical protein CHC06_06014 [Variovorax sp. B2]PNG51263.1 hypothetical protein CHC07_05920 [Variovorax sp. B4]VTU43131.1 hypothetical protein SRS16P1_00446 [Variovorax sp. SRS16]VTU43162.1 hypothetical protein E5P1_00443 [Variovorax sp. PBL-E5]
MKKTKTLGLTVLRKGDRELMAKGVEKLVRDCGATSTRREGGEYPGPRGIHVEIDTPRGLQVTVYFNGYSSQPDVYVLSWHMDLESDDTLSPAIFGGNVNPHHFRKATYVAHGYDDLCEKLRKGLDMAISGVAFRERELEPA